MGQNLALPAKEQLSRPPLFSLITKEEKLKPNFKTQYLQSGIKFEDITNFIHLWHTGDSKETLDNFLGLAEQGFKHMPIIVVQYKNIPVPNTPQ